MQNTPNDLSLMSHANSYKWREIPVLSNVKQQTPSQRRGKVNQSIEPMQRKQAMLQETHVFLPHGSREAADDAAVDGENLLDASDAVVEQQHVADHLSKHLSEERSATRQSSVELVDAETDHGAFASVLREEEVEVVSDEGVGDALTQRVDADLRTRDLRVTLEGKRNDLKEEIMDKLDVVPAGVQERNLHARRIVLDMVGRGKRTKENMLEESQTIFKGAVGTEQVSVILAELHQLANCIEAHVDFSFKTVVFHIQLCAAYSDLLP